MPDRQADIPGAEARIFVGGVIVDPRDRTVVRDDREIRLEPRAFDVLVYLARHHGRVVSRDELIATIWDDRVVGDDAVYRAVRLARSAFGDRGAEVLRTVHGRGYCCPTAEVAGPGPAQAGFRAAATARRRADRRRLPTILLATLVIAAVGAVAVWRWPALDAAASDRIAVLAFDSASAADDRRYFGRELAAELAAELTAAHGLQAFDLQHDPAASGRRPPVDARRLPGVSHVISGHWKVREPEIALHLEVHAAGSGRLLWSDNFAWPWRDLARLRAALARRLVAALDLDSHDSGESVAHRLPADAYDRFLQARHAWRSRDPGALDRAARLLKGVLAEDPDFARAYEALAAVYLVMPSWQAIDSRPAREQAYAAAREALRLDPDLGEARAILAQQAARSGRWAQAEAQFERALESEPANPTVLHWYAEFLLRVGRLEEASGLASQAVAADPVAPMPRTVSAWAAVIAGHDARAAGEARRAVELGLPSSNIILAWALLRQGRTGQAARAIDAVPRPSAAMDACRRAVMGSIDADDAVRAIVDDPRRDQLALIYHLVCLGMLGQGEAALELVADDTPGIEVAILWAPEFDDVRQTAEFEERVTAPARASGTR